MGVFSVSTARRLGTIANTHLVLVLLVTFLTYLIRDVWPLATYTEVPKDEAEGTILGIKIALLFIVAIGIPLFMPRRYIPVNPEVGFKLYSGNRVILELIHHHGYIFRNLKPR